MDQSGTGAAGTWNTTSNNWLSAGADTNWTNGSNTAFFNTTSGIYTVSLGENITAGGITVSNNNNINIGATSGETDTLTLTQDAVINAGRAVSIYAPVAGSDFTVSSGFARTVTFRTTNSFTGTLTIQSQARVLFSLATGLPSAASVKFLNSGGGTQQAYLFLATDLTAAGLSSEGGNGGKIRNNSTSGTRTLTINPDNAATPVDSTFGGVIEDNGAGLTALTKAGGHSLTLTGANTYTGATNVSAGMLVVNGSLAAGSAVTVAAAGTLGGTGTIGGATTIQGTLAPGNSPGTLAFGDDLTLESTAQLMFEIDGTTEGALYDSVDVAGILAYGGDLTLVFGFTPTAGTEFNLFDFGSHGGTFSSINIVGAGIAGNFDYTDGTFTIVPEPSASLLLMAGAGLLFVARRKRAASLGFDLVELPIAARHSNLVSEKN